MSIVAKVIMTIVTFFIGVIIMSAVQSISPGLKPIVSLTLVGAIIAIWRSKPPKKDDYQLKKN